MKKRTLIRKIATYIFLTISTFIMVYPILFMVLGSFATNAQFSEIRFLPVPSTLNIPLFKSAFEGVSRAYIITSLRIIFYVTINLATALMAGYIFSKLTFPGRNRLFLMFLSGMLMPAILMLLPDFILMARFPFAGGNNFIGQGGHGFFNEWQALFLFGWVSPFAIFLMKQSYDMLPIEYEEAAKMDGAGLFTIIFRVYGPLLKPPMVALIIITAVGIWNDYLWPSQAVISRFDLYPIAVVLKDIYMGGAGLYPSAMVRVLMAIWPPALLFFVLQRYFVQGLLASGIKG